MKAFLLHDMPYADAARPLEASAASAWVTYANGHYHPPTSFFHWAAKRFQ